MSKGTTHSDTLCFLQAVGAVKQVCSHRDQPLLGAASMDSTLQPRCNCGCYGGGVLQWETFPADECPPHYFGCYGLQVIAADKTKLTMRAGAGMRYTEFLKEAEKAGMSVQVRSGSWPLWYGQETVRKTWPIPPASKRSACWGTWLFFRRLLVRKALAATLPIGCLRARNFLRLAYKSEHIAIGSCTGTVPAPVGACATC